MSSDASARRDRASRLPSTFPNRTGPLSRSAIAITTALSMLCIAARAHDRRVVDTVVAGNALSETAHGYAGHDAMSGIADGKSYREARGWMRYALTTFDDTEVTLVWTLAPSAGDGANMAREYDVVVEDSMIATKTFSASAGVAVVETVVPFALTKGRTHIAVMLRAHGSATPRLREVRVIQDHNEQIDQRMDPYIDQQTDHNAGVRPSHTPPALQ